MLWSSSFLNPIESVSSPLRGMRLLSGHAARVSAFAAFSKLGALPTVTSSCFLERHKRTHILQPFQSRRRPLAARQLSIVAASRGKDDLLKGIDPEHREDIARILDLADQAETTWTTVFTGVSVTSWERPFSGPT